ncbi:hypothetical protein G6F56_007428 [Rhizopus delemar]|nr:hypothetical protein G6F56_007428 [Rhizopus delemar]
MKLASPDKVLDLLLHVLKQPERHGDKFFVQIVKNAKGKAIPLNLLHGMASELFKIPLDHLIRCISLDSRFELNSKKTTVRFTANPTETNADGYLQLECPIVTEPIVSADPLVTDIKNEEIQKFLNFKPYLSKIWTEDLQPKHRTLPVFYKDGKFYEDDEPDYYCDTYQSFVSVPDYKTEVIVPLGIDESIEINLNICFNCGMIGHTYYDCSEPINKAAIRARKAEKKAKDGNEKGRYFDELELIDGTNKMKPGKLSKELRDSLGMVNEGDEPPYYNNMRIYGYPPGYWNENPLNPSSTEKRSAQIQCDDEQFLDTPLLKIFGKDNENTGEEQPDQVKLAVVNDNYVQSVHYPGLFFYDYNYYISQYQQGQNAVDQKSEYYYDPQYYYQYQQNPHHFEGANIPQTTSLHSHDSQTYSIQHIAIHQPIDEQGSFIPTQPPNHSSDTNDEDIDMDISSEEE